MWESKVLKPLPFLVNSTVLARCAVYSMNNVFTLIHSHGNPLGTASKITCIMKNGWTCYWLTTSFPIDNPFPLLCSVRSKRPGMNSIWLWWPRRCSEVVPSKLLVNMYCLLPPKKTSLNWEPQPFETSGVWTWVFVEVTLWSVTSIYSLFIQWRKAPTGNGTVKWWRKMVTDNGREMNCMRWWTRLTWGCIIWMWMRGVIHVIVIVRSGRRYHAFMWWECFIGCKSTGEYGILLTMSTDTRRFNQPVVIWMRKRRSCCCGFRRRRV